VKWTARTSFPPLQAARSRPRATPGRASRSARSCGTGRSISAAWCSTSTRSSPTATNGTRRSPAAVRPRKDQPFYHLLAENGESSYVAYVSQQNLLRDAENGPVDHPQVGELFDEFADGRYKLRRGLTH
jgi:hemimethylated DNA binding protein